MAEHMDKLTAIHPDFKELLADLNTANKAKDLFESMEKKGQIFSLTSLKCDATLFAYYTGLPSYDVFFSLFKYLEPLAEDMQYVSQAGKPHHADKFRKKPGKCRSLTLEDELFATLVRLRLGLPSKDCARRFGIAESTFSVIFNTWVILLAQQLELICSMPSSDKTSEYQAPCFDNFSNVRIVLDCTEIFSQTPGSLEGKCIQIGRYNRGQIYDGEWMVGRVGNGRAKTY